MATCQNTLVSGVKTVPGKCKWCYGKRLHGVQTNNNNMSCMRSFRRAGFEQNPE